MKTKKNSRKEITMGAETWLATKKLIVKFTEDRIKLEKIFVDSMELDNKKKLLEKEFDRMEQEVIKDLDALSEIDAKFDVSYLGNALGFEMLYKIAKEASNYINKNDVGE